MSLNGLNQEYRYKSLSGLTDLNFNGITVNKITINESARFENHPNGVMVLDNSIIGTSNDLNISSLAVQSLAPDQIILTDENRQLITVAKNSAFNKDFGTSSGQVVEGSTLDNYYTVTQIDASFYNLETSINTVQNNLNAYETATNSEISNLQTEVAANELDLNNLENNFNDFVNSTNTSLSNLENDITDILNTHYTKTETDEII